MFEYNLTREEIFTKWGIPCSIDILVESHESLSDQELGEILRDYYTFHSASEERIAAADAFWKRFHTSIFDATSIQKVSDEYKAWVDATDKLMRSKKNYLGLKRRYGVIIETFDSSQAA